MSKTLLVIGCGREAIPALQRAQQMGLYVIGTDGNPHAPGFASCNKHLVVSTAAVEQTVEAVATQVAPSRHLDGVIALAADVPLTVASLAAAGGLPGPSLQTARLTADKLRMKDALRMAGVPVPWYAPVRRVEDIRRALTLKGYPLVLKPVDSRGARGVLRLTPDVNLEWAYDVAWEHSPTGRLMVEEWLYGPQISTETVLHDGWAETPAVVDRNYSRLYEFAPYCIEDGGSWPTVLPSYQQSAICEVAARAAQALGIHNWTAKGDLVLTKEGPVVIEMAARLSGGYMSSIQTPVATGVDMVGIAIRLALGDPVRREECLPQRQDGCAMRYWFPAPGQVQAIYGRDGRPRALQRIHYLDIAVQVGDIVRPVTDHTKRAGCVITRGRDRDEAVWRAEEVIRRVQIETAPAPSN
jgi:biotin carboxylase